MKLETLFRQITFQLIHCRLGLVDAFVYEEALLLSAIDPPPLYKARNAPCRISDSVISTTPQIMKRSRLVTMHKELAAIVIFPLIITLFASLSAQGANSEWNYQSIGSAGFYNQPFYAWATYSLVLDSKGYPNMVFRQPIDNSSDTNYFLVYTSWNGTCWSKKTIDHGGNTYIADDYISLAIDAYDNPHIAYITNDGLKYASRESTYWNIQIVDPKGAPAGLDLALDSQGNPHIIYSGTGSNYDLRYASWTGSSWNVDVVSEKGYEASLVMDSNDNPHICFIWDKLFYANKANLTWNIQTVDDEHVNLPFIALDSNNNPHISYTRQQSLNASNGLIYASWNDTRWHSQIVATNCEASCLILDSHDFPHIAYCGGGSNGYLYASWNGTDWSKQVIFQTGVTISGNIWLALDSLGNPHVFYGYLSGIPAGFAGGKPLYQFNLVYAYADFNQSNPSNPPNTIPWTVAGVVLAVGTIVAAASMLVMFIHRKHRKASTPL
jgi:hypothetical protein